MIQSLEEMIVFHCSPTLAMMKPACMFSYPVTDIDTMEQQLKKQNLRLNKKGIYLQVLVKRDTYWLIFVYHHALLNLRLQEEDIKAFLFQYHYVYQNLKEALSMLKEHMKEDDFPHEVGVFLGYPLADVVSFIQYEGRNYAGLGYWKVYHNPVETMQLFERFSNCVESFLAKFHEGILLENLIAM